MKGRRRSIAPARRTFSAPAFALSSLAALSLGALVLGAPAAFAQASPDPSEQPVDLARVASVVGAARGPRLAGDGLEAEAKRIASLLRCPVCQGLSVADSPATMATNMRQQVRDMVAAGFVEEQVLAYFEASYGEFVRLRPPLRGVNWLVWLAPLVGLLAGGAIVYLVLRGPSAAASPEATRAAAASATAAEPARDPLPEDPELARLVLRVRELAYGWPGGVRPQPKGQA